jgi:hypothetical protein
MRGLGVVAKPRRRKRTQTLFIIVVFLSLVVISPLLWTTTTEISSDVHEAPKSEKIPEETLSPAQRALKKLRLKPKIYHKENTSLVIWEKEPDFESQAHDHLAVQWADRTKLHSPMPRPERIETIRVLLDRVTSILDEKKIEYWMAFGTLLGSYNF